MPTKPKKTKPENETDGTEYVAETVRFSGRWFVEDGWFVRREGNKPNGKILEHHDGKGNRKDGAPPISARPVEEDD